MIITLNQSAGTAQKGCGEWVSLLKDVCSNVCKEPTLQPLTGESLQLRSASIDDGARLDISAEGFWGHRYQRVFFFDVRVFCPKSATNRSRSLMACYRATRKLRNESMINALGR